jgi:hypothetical protein
MPPTTSLTSSDLKGQVKLQGDPSAPSIPPADTATRQSFTVDGTYFPDVVCNQGGLTADECFPAKIDVVTEHGKIHGDTLINVQDPKGPYGVKLEYCFFKGEGTAESGSIYHSTNNTAHSAVSRAALARWPPDVAYGRPARAPESLSASSRQEQKTKAEGGDGGSVERPDDVTL